MALGLQLWVGAGSIITRSSASGSLFCKVVKDTQQWHNRKLHHSGNVLPLLTTQEPQEPSESVPQGTWQVSGALLWPLDPHSALHIYYSLDLAS